MKNRIFWVFEEKSPTANGSSVPPHPLQNSLSPDQEHDATTTFPWALFGKLGDVERDILLQIYREACERITSPEEDSDEQKLQRLLFDLELRDLPEEY